MVREVEMVCVCVCVCYVNSVCYLRWSIASHLMCVIFSAVPQTEMQQVTETSGEQQHAARQAVSMETRHCYQ